MNSRIYLFVFAAALLIALSAYAQDEMMVTGPQAKFAAGKTQFSRDLMHRVPSREPSTCLALTGVCDTLLFENFDSGAPGWTFVDLWSETFWHTSNTGSYSGHSYWCGDEQLGGYDDHWQQTLTSPPVSLSGTTSPVLTFMQHFRIEDCDGNYFGFDGFDAMTVRISTDGENFSVITPAAGMPYQAQNALGFYMRFGKGIPGWFGNSNGWISSDFNLDSYAGQTVWIQFLFSSDWGYSSEDDPSLFGWRLDDIRIMDGSTTVFEDNAGDTGPAVFVPGGAGGHNLWHITQSASVSPPNSAGCFDEESGNYMDGINSALISPPIALIDLPEETRRLLIDFRIQGALDHSGYDLYLPNDFISIEVRPFHDGQWDYWIAYQGWDFVPDFFYGFEEFYHFDLDIFDFMYADSLQMRLQMMARADEEVMTPARIFVDDFSVTARSGYGGPVFGAFYDRISVAPLLQRPAIADSFLSTLPQCPIVEDNSIVTFVFSGNVTKMNIPGINFSWDTSNCPMRRIIGTDFWFYQTHMLPDARQEYKFLINGVAWINDPRNPDIVPYEFNNSQIRMPEYVPPQENEFNPNIPHGQLHDTLFASTIMNNYRTIRVYVPPGYESGLYERYPVILFHDGQAFVNDGGANNVIDNLIAEHRIRPVIAVFVPPLQREREYAFDLTADFETFIVEEVMPMIDTKYRTILEPEYRAMAGSSYGGLISTQICYHHPENFGLCAPFSPSYFPKEMEVYNELVNGPKKDLRFYLDWGMYELSIMYCSYLLRDNLRYLGYDVLFNEWPDNHGMGNWRAHLDNMLEYFFPPSTYIHNEVQSDPFKLEVYPNPSRAHVAVNFFIPRKMNVTLAVYDLNGSRLWRSEYKDETAGERHELLDFSWLSPGPYLIEISAGGQSSVSRMILLR